jgi:hypothetical protein
MPMDELRGKIEAGNVLIAEDSGMGLKPMSDGQDTGCKPVPLGYCIGQDRYFKRDDVGVIYALNVSPGAHRKLVGASLICFADQSDVRAGGVWVQVVLLLGGAGS